MKDNSTMPEVQAVIDVLKEHRNQWVGNYELALLITEKLRAALPAASVQASDVRGDSILKHIEEAKRRLQNNSYKKSDVVRYLSGVLAKYQGGNDGR